MGFNISNLKSLRPFLLHWVEVRLQIILLRPHGLWKLFHILVHLYGCQFLPNRDLAFPLFGFGSRLARSELHEALVKPFDLCRTQSLVFTNSIFYCWIFKIKEQF